MNITRLSRTGIDRLSSLGARASFGAASLAVTGLIISMAGYNVTRSTPAISTPISSTPLRVQGLEKVSRPHGAAPIPPAISKAAVRKRALPESTAGELMVKFDRAATNRGTLATHRSVGARVLRTFTPLGWQQVRLPAGMTTAQGMARYRQFAGVVAVEPNYHYQAAAAPNDTSFGSQWGMTKIGAPAAWDTTTGDAGTVVAVLDSGVDYNHPDLSANMWRNPGETAGNSIDDDGNGYVDDVYGIDTYNNDTNPMDDYDHGTHCAGIIGAVGNNGVGVAGVNWNVRIMAVKSMPYYGSGTSAAAIAGLNYVVAMKNRGINIRVVSMSWEGSSFSQAVKDALDAVGNAGIVTVCAAGNGYGDNDTYATYPANYDSPGLISVAASTTNDLRRSSSNTGLTTVDLAAPGESIQSTLRNGNYGNQSGTSMAAAHVAGAVALVAGLRPALTSAEIKTLLHHSVDKLPEWTPLVVSGGRLNLARTIANVDASFIASPNSAANEGNGTPGEVAFNVVLSRANSAAVNVAYVTADGTARAGSDYTATSGTLTFAPGETSKQVRVALQADTKYERSETFTLALTGPGNAVSATGTITNDDLAVSGGGRIVFSTDRDGNREIYSMLADGSNPINLSRHSKADTKPSLSKDGSKIVFISDRTGIEEVYTMNADGSATTRLTSSNGSKKTSAVWSPDGTRIAYAIEFYGVYVMNADGTNNVRLSPNATYDADKSPSWSPDGSKIIVAGGYSFFIMNADGTGRTEVPIATFGSTPLLYEETPVYSPDGTRIAFVAQTQPSYIPHIYTANLDGSGIEQVTDDYRGEMSPVYSPDGYQLAFESREAGLSSDSDNREISTCFFDGTNRVIASRNWFQDYTPSWGPATAAGKSISGRVATSRGTALRDVKVTRTSGGVSASVYTNANGDFVFVNVPAGSYTLTASGALNSGATFSPASRSATVGAASVSGQNFTRTSTASTISGTVVGGQGQVMPNITLSCAETGATALTNATGRYSFTGLQAGTYTIAPVMNGYAKEPASYPTTIIGDDVYDRDFTVRPVNDHLANAQLLSGSSVTASGNCVAASTETAEWSGARRSVWFRWVAPATGKLVLDARGGSFSPRLNIFAGSAHATMTRLTSEYKNGNLGTNNTFVTAAVLSGTTYSISADGGGGNSTGNFTFQLAFTPAPVPTITGFTPTSGVSGTTVVVTGTGFTDAFAVTFDSVNNHASVTVDSDTRITTIVPTATASTGLIRVTTYGGTATSAGTFTSIRTYQVNCFTYTSNYTQIPNATITITGATPDAVWTAVTGTYGGITIDKLPPGTYTLRPSRAGYTFTPPERTFTVVTGAADQEFVGTKTSESIIGRVLRPNGTPFAGVTVTRSGSSTPVTTDAAGYFGFDGLTTGSYTVTPTLAGWTFNKVSSNVSVPQSSYSTLQFTGEMGLSGRVTNTAGAGMPNVAVSINSRQDPILTDAGGYYKFSQLYVGTHTVTPALAGQVFTPASRSVTMAADNVTLPDFVANSTYKIRGTVTNAAGTGLSGISVLRSGSSTPAVTDYTGAYSFTDLPAGTYTITPGSTRGTFAPTSRTATITTADVVVDSFVATLTATISGRIRTKEYDPIDGVTVVIKNYTGGQMVATLITGDDGRYTSPQLPAGTYTVEATPHPGFAFSTKIHYATLAGADLYADFIQSVARRISGSVRKADGSPVANVSVSCYEPDFGDTTVKTDANGNFTHYPLPAGTFYLFAGLSGYAIAPQSRQVTLTTADVAGVEFTATKMFTISGTVTQSTPAAANAPLADALVTCGANSVRTDAEGKYTLPRVAAGSYEVTVSATNYYFAVASQVITATTADTATANFSGVPLVTLSGRVATAAGAGVAGATVTRTNTAGDRVSATTDSNGAYSFASVGAGSYTLSASRTGYGFAVSGFTNPLALSANQTGINFVATPTAAGSFSIRGNVSNNSGAPMVGLLMSCTGVAGAVTDSSGNYVFPAVPSGTVVVAPVITAVLTGVTFSPANSVVVLTANRTNINFQATYSISGYLANHSGVGIPNVLVQRTLGTSTVGVYTNAQGFYIFPNVRSGSYTLAPVLTPAMTGMSFTPATLNATVDRANITNKNFVGMFTVRGRVANSAGTGLAGVQVQRILGSSVVSAFTDSAGNYSFSGVRSGNYMLKPVVTAATGISFTPAQTSVTVDRTNLANQNFVGLFSVSGRVATSAGTGIAGATVRLNNGSSTQLATTDSSGNYRFNNVMSGTYSLTPVLAGRTFTPASRTGIAIAAASVVNQNFVGSG